MTKAEYNRLYRQARNRFPYLTRDAMKELLKTYIKAGNLVAAEVKRAELVGLSDITIQSKRAIQRQLTKGAGLIREAVDPSVKNTASAGINITNEINEKYLIEATIDAGITGKITKVGIKNLYSAVNDRVVRSIVNRIYQDGYSFSQRVWAVGSDYEEQIKRVLASGIAQGRDPVKIAKDIQVYIKDGKIALVNRYGELKRGTKAFANRIGNKVDYRALRLVRSELYGSLQDAAIEQGKVNPGATQKFEWVLEQHRAHWNCPCPDLAAGSPYQVQEVPGYPHPNCRCQIRPVLRDYNEFVTDLKVWSAGGSVEYLDQWYISHYLQVS